MDYKEIALNILISIISTRSLVEGSSTYLIANMLDMDISHAANLIREQALEDLDTTTLKQVHDLLDCLSSGQGRG